MKGTPMHGSGLFQEWSHYERGVEGAYGPSCNNPNRPWWLVPPRSLAMQVPAERISVDRGGITITVEGRIESPQGWKGWLRHGEWIEDLPGQNLLLEDNDA